ncbi:hypothetical protein NN561_003111 [Cricetulus griseus]
MCHPRGESRQTREAAAPRSAVPHHRPSARSPPSPSPELGVRASVCKQTGHVAAAASSPPRELREPPRDLASIVPTELGCALCGSPTAFGAQSSNPRGQSPAPTHDRPADRPAIPLPGGRLPGPASAGLGCSGVLGGEGLHG